MGNVAFLVIAYTYISEGSKEIPKVLFDRPRHGSSCFLFMPSPGMLTLAKCADSGKMFKCRETSRKYKNDYM